MGSKLHTKMFRVAESVSALSDFPRIKIGAVVAHKHNVLAVGINQVKSHPLQKKYNKERFSETKTDTCQHFIHAEIDALLKVRREDLTKASLYVFRMNLNGELAISRPCPACMAMIGAMGIKKIHYTTDIGYASERLN